MEQSLSQLKEQTKGLTCLICCQGFDATIEDALEDNDFENEHELKEDVMFRLLDENLDYGKYKYTVKEENDDLIHQKLFEKRCVICEKVSSAWVDGEVSNIVEAQKLADKIISDM